jgi:ubiquinol-cytochrome c reductase cytochrome b subunit
MIGRVGRWVDDRLGLARFTRGALDKIFPDHWSFMLGEVAFYAFAVLVGTGVFLTFFFDPSLKDATYHGRYLPLHGVHMSAAYASTVRLSFDVRAGLLLRQMHHWAALVFLGAVVLHLCRVFFTGAFRRPRELNWVVGVTLLVLAIANGFAGYSLPDDLLSGTGLRIMYSIVLSVPVAGTWLAFAIFGGEFPSEQIISRLYVIHILLIPAAIAGLLSVHLAVLWRQKHTQFPGRGRTNDNVVGSHLWPTYAARSVGLFALVVSVVAFAGGLAQINPIWLYGPFHPAAVTTAAQPDWYIGWLEGALRLFPPWRATVFGSTVPEVFWPGIVLPGITFGLLYLWPFVEGRVTGDDRAEHHLLDRPRNRPVRTALGVSTLTFYVVLFVAGSQDIIAETLQTSITPVTRTLQVLVFVLPVVTGWLAWRVATDLHADDPDHQRGDERAHPVERPAPSPAPPAPPADRRVPVAVMARAGLSGFVVGAVATVAAVIAGWRSRRRR